VIIDRDDGGAKPAAVYLASRLFTHIETVTHAEDFKSRQIEDHASLSPNGNDMDVGGLAKPVALNAGLASEKRSKVRHPIGIARSVFGVDDRGSRGHQDKCRLYLRKALLLGTLAGIDHAISGEKTSTCWWTIVKPCSTICSR
jgi:hypothetical protein